MNNPQRDAVKLLDFVDGGDGAMMVVGIAESAEFAPDYQFEMAPRRDAGILVVAEDGSLKWRPLPRMPLLLCERPQGALRNIVEVNMHAPLPAAALPPYHGFYVDGQRIELLDFVRFAQGEVGRVVAMISEDLYSPSFPAEEWSYLKFGFLVESSTADVQWYKEADEDLALVSRA